MGRLLFGIAILLSSGCTTTSVISKAVDRYCDMPETLRSVNRETVAIAIYPNRIRIDCE